MRTKTREMLQKANTILEEGMPINAKDLADKCGLKRSSGYRIVRLLKEEGIGIIPAKEGYVLAKHGHIKDDMHMLKRMLGRRLSDNLTLVAADKYIQQRWKGLKKEELKSILGPLHDKTSDLEHGLSIIRKKSETLGI